MNKEMPLTKSNQSDKKNKVPDNFTVHARFVRMPPDKLRLISKLLINKDIDTCLNILAFVPNVGAKKIAIVCKNINNICKNLDVKKAWIKAIAINEAPKLKRRRIIHRGRATTILKRNSHIKIYLTLKDPALKE